MKLLVMHFPPATFYFLPLRSKYSPQIYFSNTCYLSTSFRMKEEVSKIQNSRYNYGWPEHSSKVKVKFSPCLIRTTP
jgi:hypothetical protein